jgi:hypothetical protein
MRFSEREGFKPVRASLQFDSIDKPLRNGLWNVVDHMILQFASLREYGDDLDPTLSFYAFIQINYFN